MRSAPPIANVKVNSTPTSPASIDGGHDGSLAVIRFVTTVLWIDRNNDFGRMRKLVKRVGGNS